MVIAAWPAASRGQRGRRTVPRPDGPEDAFDLSGLTALMPDGGDENRNRRFESGLRLAGEIALEVDGSGEFGEGIGYGGRFHSSGRSCFSGSPRKREAP